MRRLLATLCLVVATVGCASAPPPSPAPRTEAVVVLLPGRDGRAGHVDVERDGQRVELDTPYSTARDEGGRLQRGTSSAEEVQRVFGAALAAQPPRPVTFILYFLEGSGALTPESAQEIARVRAEIAARPAPEVSVVGHTDRVGTVPYNDALSLQRAERIRDELVRAGVSRDAIAVAGRGEREPLVPTADEVPEPHNRRVEVTVR